jgi:MFS family permease
LTIHGGKPLFDLNINKKLRYLLFCFLYLCEGLYLAIITIIIPLFLNEKEIALPIITIVTGIGWLPWALKFVSGGISDYFIYIGRKKFIIIGGFVGGISLLMISLLDPSYQLILFSIFLFIGHFGIVFLDVSIDAWAIETIPKEELGKANAAMNIGQLVGISLGAPLLALISQNISFNYAFLITGIIILPISLFPFAFKEIEHKKKITKIPGILKNEIKKRKTQLLTIFGFFVFMSPGILTSISAVFASTVLDLSDFEIGLIGAALLIFIIPGSWIGGYLADKYGRKKTLYVFIIPVLLLTILLIFVNNVLSFLLIAGLINFLWNGIRAANDSMLMEITNEKIAATEFSVINSFVNAGQVGAGAAAGFMVGLIGFDNVFIIAGIIFIIPLFILSYVKIK